MNPTSQKPDTLEIGKQLIFPQANTTRVGGSRARFWPSMVAAAVVAFVLSFVLAIAMYMDGTVDLTFWQSVFGSLIFTVPVCVWGACVATLGNSVRYTDTLEHFVEANPQTLRLTKKRAGGMIGRLINAHADKRRDEDRVTTRLSVRNDQDNIAWGVETVDQGDHGLFVGRYYTTGPYRGFAHISIKMPESTKRFPQLIIDASKNNHNFTATDLERSLGKEQQYSLEGNFPDYFKVYASDANVARVAYYVLTPDVMQTLLQYAPEFDIEFDNNRLNMYWYDPGLSSELEPDWAGFLPRAFWLLEAVAKPLSKRIEQYQIESSAAGRRLSVDDNQILKAVRDITYGRRQNLATAAAKIGRRAAAMTIGLVLLIILLAVVGIVVAVLIG